MIIVSPNRYAISPHDNNYHGQKERKKVINKDISFLHFHFAKSHTANNKANYELTYFLLLLGPSSELFACDYKVTHLLNTGWFIERYICTAVSWFTYSTPAG
jgi:hypothetical protein